ncbi:MAG: biotin/lipoyl-containing protein, partial [Thermoprotei archaeon]
MPYIFKLPDIGEGTVEAEIIRWLVKEGEKVKADQPIAEVMTEKVNIEITSPKSGTIYKILAKEGEKIRVGQPIVSILEEGEQPPEQRPQYITQIPNQTTTQQPTQILATPAVRRLARELGVDITKIKGTGPSGRITEEDVRQYAQSIKTPKPQLTEQITTAQEQQIERIPYRGIRRQIGEHMTQAIKHIPHAVHFEEVDVTELVNIREKLKENLST